MTNGIDESDILRTTLIDEAEARAGEHPGIDALAEYHHGAFEGEAEERVRDHLVGCRRCAEQLLELEPLLQPEAVSRDGVADLEIEAAWRRFQTLAGAAESLDRVAARPRWAMAAAASLAVATLTLGLWTVRLQQANTGLRRQVAEASRPVVNAPLFYFGEPTRGADPREHEIRVPPEASYFILLFPVLESEPAIEYELQFVDARDEVILRRRGVVMSETGNLQLGLPRGRLPAGDYRILRRALQGGVWQTVEEFRRRISYPVGPAIATETDKPPRTD